MSTFEDRMLVCKDCSESFPFTAERAKELEEKGYENVPARCDQCRRKKFNQIRRRREGHVKKDTKEEGEKPAARSREVKSERKRTETSGPKVERVMIDITVTCAGKENKVVHKPLEHATFAIFRRLIGLAHGGDINKNFKLSHNGEVLTYKAFNSLQNGDVVDMVEGEETA